MPQPPNLQKMLAEAQAMLAAQQEAQDKLKEQKVDASAGGGMVKVAMTGDLHLESLIIDPDAVDPEDVEMLQDMVVAAVNEAIRMATELQQSQLGDAEGMGGFDPMSALESLGLGGMGGLGGPRRRRPGGMPGGAPNRAARRQQKREVTHACSPRHSSGSSPSSSKLPGIGNRTAQRLAFHVLRASNEDALALAQAIQDVKERITLCEICFNLAEGPRCAICLDERRDTALICVVEEPGDVIPIERTHEFRGRYHVLGGALSPIDGVEPEDLRLAQLYGRMDGVREVVLATNPTTTGEATALHIAAALHERAPDVAVTRLASGLPVGGDLEYADEVTLGRAFAGRRAV